MANFIDVLRIGIAGLGEATTEFLLDYVKHPKVKVTAAADFREAALDRFQQEVKGKAYRTFKEICQSSDVDIVYIATPHELHGINRWYAPRLMTLCQSLVLMPLLSWPIQTTRRSGAAVTY